jgi:hypothetical protein
MTMTGAIERRFWFRGPVMACWAWHMRWAASPLAEWCPFDAVEGGW